MTTEPEDFSLELTAGTLVSIHANLAPSAAIDPHRHYEWGPKAIRNIALDWFCLDVYPDGRWVFRAAAHNVSEHSNWDVHVNFEWRYTTGHVIHESQMHTDFPINHGSHFAPSRIGTSDWHAQNYELLQQANVTCFGGWSIKRTN